MEEAESMIDGKADADDGSNEQADDDNRAEKKTMQQQQNEESSLQKERDNQKEPTVEETGSASTAVTSTVALSPVGSLASSSSEVVTVDPRREQLQHQMIVLSMVSAVTAAMFILTIIPLMTLVTFGMAAMSAGLLSYTTFQRLLLEFQEIVATEGFGRYLPASWMEQLTQTSLHEFMRDDTFVREWGFLGLYFVPGLTEEQLNAYLRRIPPERQQFLNRDGLGYFWGDQFMRVILGERRWRQQAIVANVPVPTIEHPTNHEVVIRSRGLDLDDSDGDSNASAAPVGLTVPANRAASQPNVEDENAGALVMNALWDGVWSYVSWGALAASQYTRQQVLEPATGLLTLAGLAGSASVTVLSLGAGIWQYSRQPMTPGQSARRFSAFWLSTSVFGGISTGVMLYAHSAIRKQLKPKPPPGKEPPK